MQRAEQRARASRTGKGQDVLRRREISYNYEKMLCDDPEYIKYMDAKLKEYAERKEREKDSEGGDKLRDLALGLHQDMLENTKENKK